MDHVVTQSALSALYFGSTTHQGDDAARAKLFELRCMMSATIAAGMAHRTELGWIDPEVVIDAVDKLIEEALK